MPETIFKVGDLVTWDYPTGPNGLYKHKYSATIDKQGKRAVVGWEPKIGWGEGPFRVTRVIEVAEAAKRSPTMVNNHSKVKYEVGHSQLVRIERTDGKKSSEENEFSGRLFQKVDSSATE